MSRQHARTASGLKEREGTSDSGIMSRGILSYLAAFGSLLTSTPALALDSAEFLEELSQDVSWGVTPSDLVRHRRTAGAVLWVGEVEDVRVSPDASDGSVVDWLAQHRSLVDPSPAGLAEPIRLRRSEAGKFAVRLSLPKTSPRDAKEAIVGSIGLPAYIVVSGEPEGIGGWGDTSVVYVKVAHMTVSDDLAVQVTDVGGLESPPTADERIRPLILEPDRFSYTFDVPDGWTYSREQAREFGVPLVFFSADSNFHHSNSVVYVNQICTGNCEGRLAQETQGVLARARQHSDALRVVGAPSIDTRSGATAAVHILDGSSDPRQAREALAFIAHSEAIILVVLSTKDAANWQADFAAYTALVAGHEFFTCDTPDLRVKCQSPAATAP